MTEPSLTHLDENGRARMVDVSEKAASSRTATARGVVRMSAETLSRAMRGDVKKGEVRTVSEIAGIMGAKRTAELIPLCHPLPLNVVDVRVSADETVPGYVVEATARTNGPTGVEMEALTAVSIACLTVYDMLKAIDRDMSIEQIRVMEKIGGSSGAYTRA
ncbi:molybdenum cofactor biosynthesis protein MoaC [alpha proteobacterium U9-1i]|nr:molybdenum cofactor biosynthesis protein MoaC [alpha proteobacterium U9-1i]